MPGGLKLGQDGNLGFKQSMIEAAPIFAALAAGYSSGRGPYAYLDQGISSLEARQKKKRDEEAAANAASAFSGLMRPGGLGGARGGAPLSYTPSQPMPKMETGVMGGGQAGIGFAGQPPAQSGMMGQTGQLGFSQAPDMAPYREAIASIESGGNYAAVGPTNSKLGRALGKYQIMEANIGPWSQEVLGRAVTPEEFLANPQLQDAIFDAKFGQYAQKFGLEGAAQAWFGGPGGVGKADRQDVLGTSVGDYGQRFVQALGASGQPTNDPMADPYVQRLMQVMAMPGLTPEQQAVVQLQLQTRIGQLTAAPPKPIEVGGVLLDPKTYQPIFDSRQQKTNEGYTLSPGQQRFDAQGQPIASVPAAEPTGPASVQEYRFYADQAQQAGQQPLPYAEWDMQRRKAGGTTVNVGGDSGALKKKLSEAEGTLWGTYLEQGNVSAGTAQDMQLLDELITLAPQGPVSGRIAQAFPGVSSAADAFQSIVKRVAPTLRAPGSGSTSDIEYDGMLKSLPQLSSRPEANAAIAGIMKAKAQINIERANVIRQFQNGEIDEATARRTVQELDQRSIMTPELAGVFAGLGTTQGQGGVPAGVDPADWEFMTPEQRALFQ